MEGARAGRSREGENNQKARERRGFSLTRESEKAS